MDLEVEDAESIDELITKASITSELRKIPPKDKLNQMIKHPDADRLLGRSTTSCKRLIESSIKERQRSSLRRKVGRRIIGSH